MERAAPARPLPASPEAMFALSGVVQYVGAAIAVHLFDELSPFTVTWARVASAAALILVVTRPGRRWTAPDLGRAALFGLVTAGMNLCFYLAIERIDLGKSVVIEFVGPVAVAAVLTRTARNALALAFAAAGVVLLSGTELDSQPGALALILGASALWAAYIVLGRRLAMLDRGVHGLGVSLAVGALALTPSGLGDSGAMFSSVRLTLLAVVVGACSSAVPYGIDQLVLRRIPVRRFAVLLALFPVMAMIVGAIALDQPPRWIDVAGAALVVTGVFIQDRDEVLVDQAATETA